MNLLSFLNLHRGCSKFLRNKNETQKAVAIADPREKAGKLKFQVERKYLFAVLRNSRGRFKKATEPLLRFRILLPI